MLQKEAQLYFSKLGAEIRSLNRGGCLYASYGVYLKLKKDKKLNDKITLIQFSKNTNNIKHNKEFLNGNNKKAKSDYHFALSFDDGKTIIDSTGEIIKSEFKHILKISADKIDKFSRNALKNGGWNDAFVREYHVPRINKILNVKMFLYL